jgi:hypothetical protein
MNEQLIGLLGLDPEKIRQQQQMQGLLSAGLNILSAAGPSRTPTSLGQIIAQGGAAGLQSYQQAGESAIDRALRNIQIQGLQEDLTQKRQQREALQEYFAPGANVSQALAAGKGPTPAAAQMLNQTRTGGGRSPELLRRIASDPRLPIAERQLAIKELEVTGPKPLQLDQAATLYAINQGYDIQNLTRDQAADILAKTKELTPDQLIALGRFQRETGLNIPGLTLGGRTTAGERPAAQPTVQPTAQPAAETTPKFNPTVQSAPGLTLQQRQELASKLEEARPKVISGASSMLNMLDDKRNTALQLLNNKSALDAISGTLGKIAVESGVSTVARDANLLLQNVKSRNFVLGIQEMRNNSPTGGAVGNVAIPEMESISNIEAAMVPGQSRKQLEAQLQQVVKASDRAKQSLINSIRRDYGNIEIPTAPSVVSTRPPGAKPIPQGAIDKLRADPSLRKDFDDYYGAGSADSILGK